MTDTEYQCLLAPAATMSSREAAGHYYNLAEQWYHLQNNKAIKAFSKHIIRIIKLLSSKERMTRLDAIRALAFIAACPRLHRKLFENGILRKVVKILKTPEGANCEAALVVLNHLCTQSSRSQSKKFMLVTEFCKDKQSLVVIFRYAHVEDRCLSIIANVMSVLAALCEERRTLRNNKFMMNSHIRRDICCLYVYVVANIQEHCIRAGIMERAFNLKMSHRDRIVRTNVDLYLSAMQLENYSVDKFKFCVFFYICLFTYVHTVYSEMNKVICEDMGFQPRALCLAIWRLIATQRFQDAVKVNTLFTTVQRISMEDPHIGSEWPMLPDENEANQQNNDDDNAHNGLVNHNNNNVDVNGNSINVNNGFQYIDDDKDEQQNNIEQKEPEDEESSPPQLLKNPSYVRLDANEAPNQYSMLRPDKYDSNNNHSELGKLPKLQHDISWLEQDIHIAILQTNPIESDDGANLALNAERKQLENIFGATTRGLKIFFGVLTKDSLIRCIQRGAQIVHISGHGPFEKKLKVENNRGQFTDLSADSIKHAITKSNNSKGTSLKLVFVSTCYSENVAESFCNAGVPHVVAVHSMVQIADTMATKFASAFYEGLIASKKSVHAAFVNSKAELLLENAMDCCCRHEGHKPECRCPTCKVYRCCSVHHGPKSNNPCTNYGDFTHTCCQPHIPHKHSDKFLLLPKNNNHDEQILHNMPSNVDCQYIDSRVPTNIGQPNQKIVGRSHVLRNLVHLLHPDEEKQGDVVLIYGRPKVGLTTCALQVGRFFTRPWYQPMFLGGVFRINLQNCDDPQCLYSYIAQAMNIKHVIGSYSYHDRAKQRYTAYPEQTQIDLHRALSGDDITDPIRTFDHENGTYHYIILDQHKNHRELLKHHLPTAIYKEFERRIRSLPMEFYLRSDDPNDEKVIVRPIKFTPPDEEAILQHIKNYGSKQQQIGSSGSHNVMFQKLFIIDHITFPRPKIKQFLQKIKRLIENVKCKLLMVCHRHIQSAIHSIQSKDVSIQIKQRLLRIPSISRKDAAKLLLDSARTLYEFDFVGYQQPSTTDETSQFALFEWLSKSPSLIHQTSTVLDRKVPFCVICNMMNQEPSKWKDALNQRARIPSQPNSFRAWKDVLQLQPDDVQDGINALTSLLTEINVVRSIWSDQIQ